MYKQLSTSSVLNNKWTVPVVVGVSSFTLGAVGGWVLGRRSVFKDIFAAMEKQNIDTQTPDNQLAFDFDEQELADVVQLHPKEVIHQEYSFVDDLDAVDEYTEYELDWDAELSLEEDELEDAQEINNIFAGSDEEWDYDKELMSRGTDPYVIHVDEFVADEMGFDQRTYTYYAEDNILADDNDIPVYNHANVVGPLRFGHGSKDPSLVYIRNEKTQSEYEIIRHTGSFAVEVRGLEIESQYEEQELRHARGPQRFRMD